MPTTKSPASTIPDLGDNVYDAATGALTVLRASSKAVIEGFSYTAWHKFSSIADAANADVLIKVPAGLQPYLQQVAITAGDGNIDIFVYEAPTTSADGTELTYRSLNRNGTVDAPDLDMFQGPTVSGVGSTQLGQWWVPPTASGTGSSDDGNSGAVDVDKILKPSTNYLVRATNNSGGATDILMQFLWQEIGY